MENYHIKSHDGHWDLTKQGADHAAISKSTKAEILMATQKFVEGKTASVKTHRAEGTFEEERTCPRSADPSKAIG
jgi:hypothetical protein